MIALALESSRRAGDHAHQRALATDAAASDKSPKPRRQLSELSFFFPHHAYATFLPK
jgi:hypothetical protein